MPAIVVEGEACTDEGVDVESVVIIVVVEVAGVNIDTFVLLYHPTEIIGQLIGYATIVVGSDALESRGQDGRQAEEQPSRENQVVGIAQLQVPVVDACGSGDAVGDEGGGDFADMFVVFHIAPARVEYLKRFGIQRFLVILVDSHEFLKQPFELWLANHVEGHQRHSKSRKDFGHVTLYFLVCVTHTYDGRTRRAQLYGTSAEGCGVGVAPRVGEQVDVDAGKVVLDIVTHVELFGILSYIERSGLWVVELQFVDAEVAACSPTDDVDVHQVGVEGEGKLILSFA